MKYKLRKIDAILEESKATAMFYSINKDIMLPLAI